MDVLKFDSRNPRGSGGLRSLGELLQGSSLHELNLSGCLAIGDDGLESISSSHPFRFLEKLNLSRCPSVSDIGISSLEGLSRLYEIIIDGSGASQASLHSLSSLPGMEALQVALRRRHLETEGAGLERLESSPLMMPAPGKGRKGRARNGSNASSNGSLSGSLSSLGSSPLGRASSAGRYM